MKQKKFNYSLSLTAENSDLVWNIIYAKLLAMAESLKNSVYGRYLNSITNSYKEK